MKTTDLRDDDGELIGFEVSNLLLSRGEAERVIRQIPGVSVLRPVRRLFSSEPDRDDFCVFKVGGTEFEIVEPFGDNDCYWIVRRTPGEPAGLGLVRSFFVRWKWFRSPVGILHFAIMVVMLAVIIKTLVSC
jgi:hypothetical protein